MLDLGVDIAFGGLRVLGYVEREVSAAALLLERMEDAALEPAPVFAGDLADFPWASFRGLVDVVSAGFPCQPHSVAGSRKGIEDERWIWPEISAGIRVLGPRFVVLENVRGLRSSGGLGPVLADLATLGFRIAWTSLRAIGNGVVPLQAAVAVRCLLRYLGH
jgi:DNA (cytosine-5)-methyltransferase 1